MSPADPSGAERYDFLVFIGRFQPFHNGHLAVIREGLRRAEQIIVLCGSAHQPRSIRNPWTVDERKTMLYRALGDTDAGRVHVLALMDRLYNNEAWLQAVQTTVEGIVTAQHIQQHVEPRIGLIGHSKDQTSYYLKMFPHWDALNVASFQAVSSTPLRTGLLEADGADGCAAWLQGTDAVAALPENVREFLIESVRTAAFQDVCEEYRFVRAYQSGWDRAPYPPTFVTVDACVVQSGHLLMVERKARPGKGLLALPGGFVNHDETLEQACLRELREETRIKVPVPVLRGSIKRQAVFDEPHRSARGRTITHGFYIELNPDVSLPRVKGGDDARHALWIPFADLDATRIFEDHYFIIQELVRLQ